MVASNKRKLSVPASPASSPASSSSCSEDTAATSKKFRSAIDETVAEFICPISQELPLDPVTAEDGRVYEKASIEEWLAQKQTSPVTNVAMGTRLLPAVQVRSVIRNLVQSGAISGDKADKWQQRIAEEKEFVDTRKRAEDGDCNAMNFLGIFYNQGTGVRKDVNQARRWYRKSAELGEVRGLTNLAVGLYEIAEYHTTESLVYITEAATRGDAWACMQLAECFAEGNDECASSSLPYDMEMAKRWNEKALKCTNDEGGCKLDEDDRLQVNKWLGANTGVASIWKC